MDSPPFVLEGLVSTIDRQGAVQLSPMGPWFSEEPRSNVRAFLLRPFRSSHTYRNLSHTPFGAFHVVDDIELLVEAVIGRSPVTASFLDVPEMPVKVLKDCCRWMAFEVMQSSHVEERATMECVVRSSQSVRDFVGWNRAKHAILELAIVATRLHMLDELTIRTESDRTERIVAKTGGDAERRAQRLLTAFIDAHAKAGRQE